MELHGTWYMVQLYDINTNQTIMEESNEGNLHNIIYNNNVNNKVLL